MRKQTALFLIDGKPMLAPDWDVEVSRQDIDAADSGRDESGFLHRVVVRRDVGKWTFTYFHLTAQEYSYMESLFAGKDNFQFTYPAYTELNVPLSTTAYRSKHGIAWRCAVTGDIRDYQFSILEC